MSVKSSFFYGDPVSHPGNHVIPSPTCQAGPNGLKRAEVFLVPPLVWKDMLSGDSSLKISSIKLFGYWFNYWERKATVKRYIDSHIFASRVHHHSVSDSTNSTICESQEDNTKGKHGGGEALGSRGPAAKLRERPPFPCQGGGRPLLRTSRLVTGTGGRTKPVSPKLSFFKRS